MRRPMRMTHGNKLERVLLIYKSMKSHLTGLIAAPFTPMLPDGSLNLPIIEQQADRMAAIGVAGAFVCGTTGEGMSLTTAERLQIAERWISAARKRLKVIVHVGHNNLGESRELAAHAERIGADAIATTGPSFFRPSNVAGLVEFCGCVAKGAPKLPFYFYHMPSMTGINMPMIEFLKLGSKRIPTLAGIKFTDENLMGYTQCLRFEDGRFNILFGRDEILLAALAMGAKGAVGSTYNYMAPIYHRVRAAFERGDIAVARSHQAMAIEIIAVMIKYGGLPAGKAMMKMIGIDCGPVRSPLQNLATNTLAAFQTELAKTGFPGRVTEA